MAKHNTGLTIPSPRCRSRPSRCNQAQTPATADTNEARIETLITASHILANEGSTASATHRRSVTDPTTFMPRAMPALVSRADIVELDLD